MTTQLREVSLLFPARTPPQRRISQSTSRFNVACWGRQSGKTTFGIQKLVWKPLQGRRHGIYWHVLQTYGAAEIAFDRMDRILFRSKLIRKKSNQSDLCQFLANGANIFFKSGDKPQNLRAETLDGAIIDECRQQQKEIWGQIIFPMLGRYNGWADFYSSPSGYDWFYDLYDTARTKNPLGEWSTFHAPSTESWWWHEAQIAQARATMSEPEFSQEILAEFRELHSGKAYLSHGAHNHKLINPFSIDGSYVVPYLPIVVACDFNVGHMRWTLGQQRNEQFYWMDEIAINNTNTQECAREMVQRIGTHPAGVILVGDATGNSRHSSASESDYVIICQELDRAGIRWDNRTPAANPSVKERVNTMNAKLRAADGRIAMWLNPAKCPMLKRDLDRVIWKEGAQSILDQTKDKSLTHSSDGVGYAACALAPMEISGMVGGLSVIRR